MHADAILRSRVLVVDDLAGHRWNHESLLRPGSELKGKVCGIAVLIELVRLSGRDRVKPFDVHSILK